MITNLIGEDFIRTQIISKKLNPKLLEAEDFQDKKLIFYGYMIQYWISEENYFEVAKSYQHMLNTEKVKEKFPKENFRVNREMRGEIL